MCGILFHWMVALCTVRRALLFISCGYHAPVSNSCTKKLAIYVHQGLECMECYLSFLQYIFLNVRRPPFTVFSLQENTCIHIRQVFFVSLGVCVLPFWNWVIIRVKILQYFCSEMLQIHHWVSYWQLLQGNFPPTEHCLLFQSYCMTHSMF
jgi:hypothetical protein